MTCIFKANPKPDLVNALNRHSSIKAILDLTNLSLDGILTFCSLEIPEEYEPNVGWSIAWNPDVYNINHEHIDLIQIILKFAWSYSMDSSNMRLSAFLNRELSMFEAGMKLQSIHHQQIEASKKERTWKALDNWIVIKLKNKKKLTYQELWDALPESYDGKDIYREKDVLYCSKGDRNPIKFRGFCDHIRRVKNKIKYG
jgi:hypothetical protein